MLQDGIEVLADGDGNGNQMVFRLRLPSGREIVGMGTDNVYGGEWDLGPTWNYLVQSDPAFLVDTGRHGMGRLLLALMGHAGVAAGDLQSVVLSHGHEDHDGGLTEIVRETGARVLAHPVYAQLIRTYPAMAPCADREAFPASCWHCIMPESFSQKHCRAYHVERSGLTIHPLSDWDGYLDGGISVLHLPGHSPDAVALLIGNEAILVGDTLLPQITPHPTREAFHDLTREVLPAEFGEAPQIYGLRAYIRSVKRLGDLGRQFPGIPVLPAHRLYYHGQWNHMDLEARAREMLDHHVRRCAEILQIVQVKPRTAEEIAEEHFEPRLLKGMGMRMAVNEVLSHCELLQVAGDVEPVAAGRITATGCNRFESLIDAI